MKKQSARVCTVTRAICSIASESPSLCKHTGLPGHPLTSKDRDTDRQAEVVRSDRLLAKKKTGKAKSCKTTERITRPGIDLSYKNPSIALPINQAIPKPVSKTPKAVLRFAAETTLVRTALSSESCAPMPRPHSIMPMRATPAPPRKTKGANEADSRKATINVAEPIRSRSRPNTSDDIAPTPIATE